MEATTGREQFDFAISIHISFPPCTIFSKLHGTTMDNLKFITFWYKLIHSLYCIEYVIEKYVISWKKNNKSCVILFPERNSYEGKMYKYKEMVADNEADLNR